MAEIFNIHIEGSSRMTREEFLDALYHADRTKDYVAVMAHRSEHSLLCEQATHWALYHLGLFRSHTESVDLNWPQKWYEKIGYFIFGNIALIFYR